MMVLCGPDDVAERLALATRAIPLASALSSPLADMWGRLWRMEAAYQLDGQMSVVDEELTQIVQIARTTRLPLAAWHLLRWQAARAALTASFVEARSLSAQALDLAVRMQDPSAAELSPNFALGLSVLRGDPSELPADGDALVATPSPLLTVRTSQALGLYQLGRREDAAARYEQLRVETVAAWTQTPYSTSVRAVHFFLELTVAFEDTETAQVLYDRLHPYAAQCGGGGSVFLWGSMARQLGRLAALLGRHDDAIGHFRPRWR